MNKIVHVITGLGVGGAETFLLRLIPELVKAGYESSVIYLTGKGEYESAYRLKGIRVIPLNIRSPLGMIFGLRRLLKVLRAESPDLIQTWMYHANLLGGVAGKLLQLPVIWTIRQSNLDLSVNKSGTWLAIRVSAFFSRILPQEIIYNSEAARWSHESVGFSFAHTRILANGIDQEVFTPSEARRTMLREELGVPKDAIVIGHVARYDIQKDHETFIRAIKIARVSVPELRVLMIGSKVDWTNQTLTRDLMHKRDADWLDLLGSREDVQDLYNAMDIFCSSSIGESCPNVVLEAMMMGLPCIVTDVGDSRRIVGSNGVVVSPMNPEKLAEELVAVATLSPAERRAIGTAMRTRALDGFTLSSAANRFVDCYNEMVGGFRSK